MNKIAFIFPGQGAQYVGMGKEFYDTFETSKKIFDKSNEVLGFDLKNICFEDNDNMLNLTKITQPAILTTSIAILEVLKEYKIVPSATAGLSLGEYSALVCSGSLSYEEAVKLVYKRGTYMQEAVPVGKGSMAAIIGLAREDVVNLCKEVSNHGIIEIANLNCPGQIVVGGEVNAIDVACEKAMEYGARKAVKLAVSAPFHTSMLKPAGDKLKIDLDNIDFKELSIPVVTNVNANYVDKPDDISKYLEMQVYNSVMWEDSIRKMIDDGIDTFIEIGPGKTLCSFNKKINKSISSYRVEDIKTLEKTLKKLEVVF